MICADDLLQAAPVPAGSAARVACCQATARSHGVWKHAAEGAASPAAHGCFGAGASNGRAQYLVADKWAARGVQLLSFITDRRIVCVCSEAVASSWHAFAQADSSVHQTAVVWAASDRGLKPVRWSAFQRVHYYQVRGCGMLGGLLEHVLR